MPNYFEQLLGKIADAEERDQFNKLAEKHGVADWVIDPTIRGKAEEVNAWADEHWDHVHGMSRLEFQQQEELAVLKNQLGEKGNGVDLNELNAHLGQFMADKKLMTREDYDNGIKEKEQEFSKQLGVMTTLATRIPYLNAKYKDDFGEMFDPDAFVTQANEKGFTQYGVQGLDRYYEEFTAEKRNAKAQAELERKIQEAKDAGRKEALAEAGMSSNPGSGVGPAIDGSPEMGHFERRVRGSGITVDPAATTVPAEVKLGQGVGRFAALAAEARDRQAALQ